MTNVPPFIVAWLGTCLMFFIVLFQQISMADAVQHGWQHAFQLLNKENETVLSRNFVLEYSAQVDRKTIAALREQITDLNQRGRP